MPEAPWGQILEVMATYFAKRKEDSTMYEFDALPPGTLLTKDV